jgi:pre-mRNA branch site protein p14
VHDLSLKCIALLLCSFVSSGTAADTRGTAFVVYDDVFDAKNACEHLSGFNIMGRYLIVLYYQPNKATKKTNLKKKEEELMQLKDKYGVE